MVNLNLRLAFPRTQREVQIKEMKQLVQEDMKIVIKPLQKKVKLAFYKPQSRINSKSMSNQERASEIS